ncbi:Tat proofreading chaperone DmsD [Adlercreutzia muris]|jgi:TorA maturation chaperone TorD|uniref:Tat proofreading chaperone DmsD n=1 Tax=Adlercreutzia muris TaxID=1796610 RepID=UPI002172F76C|nr:Tat proofreading chaperone DmsD [Adlercreutzia muris]MCI8305284.1 Tat proofreading chaperone DmsD [Enterorhabdus sp.]MCI9673205.1 Tat proofreading chaperone DmsD [Enterorhabdus sp.]MCU7585046.1 Tat proofreading chaperone DmsD [Adlercreutzia muris]
MTEATEPVDAIVFAGASLAPFFLNDPRTGDAADAFAALAELDVAAAAAQWPFAGDEVAAVEGALAAMKEGLAAGADHDDVVWEYRRLFVGPGHLPAPPWGSVYTDRECVVFGESTLALRAWMRAVGVERLADERTPEDHIGLMLALLSFLAAERSELVDDYLRDHLLTWAPHYLEALEEAAEQPFYAGLARLTRLTLAGLQRERGLTVELPRFYR